MTGWKREMDSWLADDISCLSDTVDHLARIVEEQAAKAYAWNTSEAFGSRYPLLRYCMRFALIMLINLVAHRWSEFEVLDSLQFTCKLQLNA